MLCLFFVDRCCFFINIVIKNIYLYFIIFNVLKNFEKVRVFCENNKSLVFSKFL